MIVNFVTRPGKRGVRYLYCRLRENNASVEFKLEYVLTGSDQKVGIYKSQVENALYDLYNTQLIRGRPADPQTIKHLYLSKFQDYYVLETFREYIDSKVKPRVLKKDIGKASLEKFECVYEHLKDFINARGRADMNWQMIDSAFVEEFDDFLRQFNSHNTAMKNLYKFKTVVIYAIKVKRYLTDDPFAIKSLALKKVTPVHLTETELISIVNKEMSVERLANVRDLFLFQCFTGLAYADMRNLRTEWIDNQVIKANRQKSGEPSLAYMYEIARAILKKHGGKLPIVSNQKMNAYLKEIADICGISKKLTTHVARHTYATTVNLKNGVSLQTVQKLLGHATIKQTEHYARLDESDVRNVCNKASKKVNKLYNIAKQLEFFEQQTLNNGKKKNH